MDYSEKSCEYFVQALASKEPVPGGGGASALVGAIGMALGNMVGSLTLNKKKYADVQEDIMDLKEKADDVQCELLKLIAKDADAFKPLSAAYGLPKDTDLQRAEKARVMEKALKDACAVPFEIMKKCCEAIDIIDGFAKKGASIAISDAGCGAACCKAALKAASLNVFINTKSMTDRAFAEDINAQSDALLAIYIPRADEIYAFVSQQLR